MISWRTLLASLMLHVALIYALGPGHQEEHTIHWFEGTLELGEPGDGHRDRAHFHQIRKKKPAPAQAAAEPEPGVVSNSAASAEAIAESSDTLQTFEEVDAAGAIGSGGTALSPVQRYLLELVRRLNALKSYPRDALLNEEEGTVVVTLVISKDGQIASSELSKPCPFRALNLAGVEAVKSLGSLPPLPGELTRPIRVRIPITYKLAP